MPGTTLSVINLELVTESVTQPLAGEEVGCSAHFLLQEETKSKLKPHKVLRHLRDGQISRGRTDAFQAPAHAVSCVSTEIGSSSRT